VIWAIEDSLGEAEATGEAAGIVWSRRRLAKGFAMRRGARSAARAVPTMSRKPLFGQVE
jgi:hypothetical protein